ncbi:MAG: epoxyqueuosine reductase [Clostridia bacterium]|nr:epoxyqueuosine reductase [Clostridia bacterium]
MKDRVKALLGAHGITAVAAIALTDVTVTRPYLLERQGITAGTAFLFAVPYYTTDCDANTRNISAYAVSRDYHGFFAAVFADVLPCLKAEFQKNTFAGFADHSPIAEVEAAVKAGLGVLGKNHLFLSHAHGSYAFLGEIITDALLETTVSPLTACADCGACARACPVGLDVTRCLSALTQRKGALTAGEQAALLAHGMAWGCDRCQEVCPHNRAAREAGGLYTEIPYFKESAIPHLTAAMIETMSDEEFAARAYSWRGRAVILRNLALLEASKTPTNS